MADREKVIKALEYCVLTDDCRLCEYWMERVDHDCQIMKDALELLKEQPEIIRCKDCEHFEHWYKDKGRCFLWQETGIDVFEDGYCNYGKRKDGEVE